jgi:hypothetical protein
MDGLNKKFMQDPSGFLKKYPIDTRGTPNGSDQMGRAILQQGIAEFDLAYSSKKGKECVVLQLFEDRWGKRMGSVHKASTGKSHRITAYWLAWASKTTTRIELGEEADFFFTSGLGGCRIQVAGNVVAHIAGDSGGSMAKQKEWRDGQALETFGEETGRSRAFSSSDHYGNAGIFVGYRVGGIWRFAGQKVISDTDKWKVGDMTETLGGKIFE